MVNVNIQGQARARNGPFKTLRPRSAASRFKAAPSPSCFETTVLERPRGRIECRYRDGELFPSSRCRRPSRSRRRRRGFRRPRFPPAPISAGPNFRRPYFQGIGRTVTGADGGSSSRRVRPRTSSRAPWPAVSMPAVSISWSGHRVAEFADHWSGIATIRPTDSLFLCRGRGTNGSDFKQVLDI